MSEEEIMFYIEQLKAMPISMSEKVNALRKLLQEKGITDEKPYIDKLFE